jgi:coenzyme F420-0:L-glutamate ligase / coenzyme F420-1:gamma-L-glutamate ligase
MSSDNGTDRPTSSFTVHGLEPFPVIDERSDLPGMLFDVASRSLAGGLRSGDVVVVACKPVSMVEGRGVRLADVVPSPEARRLSEALGPGFSPSMVELVLRESRSYQLVRRENPAGQRAAYPVVINAVHRRGYGPLLFGGVDRDWRGPEAGHAVFLLPDNCDQSADAIRHELAARANLDDLAVILADTDTWPDRVGTMSIALGSAGIVPQRTSRAPSGVHSAESLVDMLANAAAIVMGQGSRGVPAAVVRGVNYEPTDRLGVLDMIREADRR